MSGFWDLALPPASLALVDHASGTKLAYRELASAADTMAARLPNDRGKSLGFLSGRNRAGTIVAYLASLRRGGAVYLGSPQLDARQHEALVAHYRPDWIVGPAAALPPGYRAISSPVDSWGLVLCLRQEALPDGSSIHPDLAVLLSTSGTTGSPKLVRLSFANIQANAEAIRAYLRLNSDDRPVTSPQGERCCSPTPASLSGPSGNLPRRKVRPRSRECRSLTPPFIDFDSTRESTRRCGP
jgi:acyl-CoA synthetase (AMP-forming)/AMP-acid ligase II